MSGIVAPQTPQKRSPSGRMAPHAAQITPAPLMAAASMNCAWAR